MFFALPPDPDPPMSALPDETLPPPRTDAPPSPLDGAGDGGTEGVSGLQEERGSQSADANVGASVDADAAPASADVAAGARIRKRPRPGERRVQILQTLAQMLEQPGAERITTAALAARLQVSEAALYRHFASKAQMFEGLIEFIESSVFSLVNQLLEREADPALQARRIVAVLLQFGEKNPGMARVMVGDALVFEHERLGARMNQFFDRVESQLRQSLRAAAEQAGSTTPTVTAQALASALTALAIGRLQRFARSGFRRLPTEQLEPALIRLTQAA
jgi:TetR/AcrR family transcriptional regulator